ncbi:MAG: MotA/TolQ/ExbB proton channel family protein [Lachnospiraceae bacterium]|nr:MotA/TolQ/ExbB proton channel family protein [Lachnospiraceae bacterium]
MRRRPYELWLLITYIALLAVCIYLNLFSAGQAGGLANLIVNIVMFVIVALILFDCYFGSFLPTAGVIKDLRRVNAKIEDDAKHTHDFLWERYKEDNDGLFKVPVLREQFKDYRYEQERILNSDKAYYKCDMEDYVNYDLVDSLIHRNRMNQVAGVMTGLGILGTFIGLSLGLQSFNTGSTAEITDSIEPLMAGIKVAFHTSIYGMVFSLVFNYVYKRILDDAEQSVRAFLATFKKYVLPDTSADGINRLIELEKQQTGTIKEMADKASYLMSDGLKSILEPQFDRFNDTITGFANMATKNQMDQLAMVVNAFISEMNASLSDMFTKLSGTVDSILAMQGENEKQMNRILERNVNTADNISLISERTGEMSDALKMYADKLQDLQGRMSATAELLKQQREEDHRVRSNIADYIFKLEDYRKTLDSSINMADLNIKTQTKMMGEIKDAAQRVPAEVRGTFDVINGNFMMVEEHFKEIIGQIQQVLAQMSDQIEYSYNGIEQSFVRTAKAIEELAGFMQRLEEYYTGGLQI